MERWWDGWMGDGWMETPKEGDTEETKGWMEGQVIKQIQQNIMWVIGPWLFTGKFFKLFYV